MRWLPVAVMCAGWAWAGFTASPVQPPVRGVLGVAVACSLLLAWWCGRRSGRAGGIAVASARAEARAAAASVAGATAAVVVNVGGGNVAARAEHAGLDTAPWMLGAQQLVEVQDAGYQVDVDGVAVEDGDTTA